MVKIFSLLVLLNVLLGSNHLGFGNPPANSISLRLAVCRLRLKGGAQSSEKPDLWDSDSYEPEHRFLHPDQLMLDEKFDDRVNITGLERMVMNRTRAWMRELIRRETEDKTDTERRPYVDVSDIEIDSEEYKYFENVSNPHRFDYGSAMFPVARLLYSMDFHFGLMILMPPS
jgi:hypothetical protein